MFLGRELGQKVKCSVQCYTTKWVYHYIPFPDWRVLFSTISHRNQNEISNSRNLTARELIAVLDGIAINEDSHD